MNLTLFLSALRARLGVFVMAFGVTVMAATALTLMLPKSYRATVSLVVDTKDEQSLSNVVIIPQREMRIAYIQTQVDIITSEKVARKVVHDLNLTEDPAVRAALQKKGFSLGSIKTWVTEHLPPSEKKEAATPESIEEWLVETLMQRVKVETSQSSIIHITFSWSDPRFAALVANGFAQAV